MFNKAGGTLKRVPKWAWYTSAGVLAAGGIMYFRNRSSVTDPSGGDVADEGAVGYTDANNGYSTGLIVAGQSPGEAVSSEINTDIPSSTLGVFGDIFTGLFGLLETQSSDNTELLGILAGAGGTQGGSEAGGTVTVAPPPSAPAPRPNPVSKLEAGYRAGATVDMGPNARKTFPGAIGWVRIADGGTGAGHWIDVHVRFCAKLERWRVYPNKTGHPWNKIWQGDRPNIC